ncbi:MAG: Calx-beta domain-containing protein, partial [Dehalococcoidia bacterium]
MPRQVIRALVATALLGLLVPATAHAAAARLRIADVTVTEGDAGVVVAKFKVSLSRKAPAKITVKYATANQTALAGSDYTAKRGTLVFKKGQKAKAIVIQIHGEAADEPDETFLVRLSKPTRARIADKNGLGKILDNDAPATGSGGSAPPLPRLSVNGTTVTEGNTGAPTAVFTVHLSAPSSLPVSTSYATADGTASAGSDYQAKSGTLTFAPGETTKEITVPITEDELDEENERFAVALADPVNATIQSIPRGDVDIVVAHQFSQDLSLLIGNGDATFQPPVEYEFGRPPGPVALGDVNNDGKPDLAVAD